MTQTVKNLKFSIIPRSDQLNSDQLLSGPMTITVSTVSLGSADQPVAIGYAADPSRPFKPCKTMRKVLILAWGDDGNEWIGRSMTLFCDPSVKWAGEAVGGIRISHLSHIEKDISVSLTATRGKKAPFVIKRMEAPVTRDYRKELADSKDMAATWKSFPAAVRTELESLKEELKAKKAAQVTPVSEDDGSFA
jgi:hypothetical protein